MTVLDYEYDALVEVSDVLRAALDEVPTGRLVLMADHDSPVGRVVRDYLWSL